MRFIRRLSCAGCVAVASLTIACNAVLGVDDVALVPPDSAPPPPPADAAVACNVNSDFGLVVSNPSTTVLSHRTSDGGPSLLFLLNTDAKPDSLGMLLYDGMGGHGTLNAPGTYSLSTADSRLETCGICLAVYVDFDRSTSQFSQIFWALPQGTLTLSKADSTRLTGRMQGLKFRHVDVSSNTTTDIADGCTVTVEDVQFDMPYPP